MAELRYEANISFHSAAVSELTDHPAHCGETHLHIFIALVILSGVKKKKKKEDMLYCKYEEKEKIQRTDIPWQLAKLLIMQNISP